MKKIVIIGLSFVPFMAFAQFGGVGDVNALNTFVQTTLKTATQLILAAAVVWFLWGVFQFVMAAGDEEAQKTGKKHIMYGIIGIAVMVSVWGLVNFLTKSAGLTDTPIAPPSIGL